MVKRINEADFKRETISDINKIKSYKNRMTDKKRSNSTNKSVPTIEAKIKFYQDVLKLDDLAEGIYVDPDPSEKLLEGEVSAYLQLLRQRKKRGEKQIITENDRQYIHKQLSVSNISDDKVHKMIDAIVKAGICKDENEVIRRAVESFFVTVFPLSQSLRTKS